MSRTGSASPGIVARRRVGTSWRDAVGARAAAAAPERLGRCLARFDGLLGEGRTDAEAAFMALREHDLLWALDAGPPAPGEEAAAASGLPDV